MSASPRHYCQRIEPAVLPASIAKRVTNQRQSEQAAIRQSAIAAKAQSPTSHESQRSTSAPTTERSTGRERVSKRQGAKRLTSAQPGAGGEPVSYKPSASTSCLNHGQEFIGHAGKRHKCTDECSLAPLRIRGARPASMTSTTVAMGELGKSTSQHRSGSNARASESACGIQVHRKVRQLSACRAESASSTSASMRQCPNECALQNQASKLRNRR